MRSVTGQEWGGGLISSMAILPTWFQLRCQISDDVRSSHPCICPRRGGGGCWGTELPLLTMELVKRRVHLYKHLHS